MLNRRRDAKLIKGLSHINLMFPYIMRTRVGSQVFFSLKFNLEKTDEYIQEKTADNGRRDLTFFDVLVAAAMRTITQKPHLNRFIKGRRYYQRKDLSATFIVKRSLTEDGDERQAIVKFDPKDTLADTSRRLRGAIDEVRTTEEDGGEKVMKILFSFPGWLVNGFTKLLTKFDDWGIMPASLAETDGMHTSVYIANLGSIGFDDAPFHHLYEWGTNSIFLTIGRVRRESIVSRLGEEKVCRVINGSLTIDERISEGLYYANAIRLFKKYVENPRLMETVPELPGIWTTMAKKGSTVRADD